MAQREARALEATDALEPPPSAQDDGPSRLRPHDGNLDTQATKGSDEGKVSTSSTRHRAPKDGLKGQVKGKSKKGKKAKHVPGQYHRDDRKAASASASGPGAPDDQDEGKEHGEDDDSREGRKHHTENPKHDSRSGLKPKHGQEERRYLSSSPRVQPRRSMSLWDYDRHTKRMGEFNPVLGMESSDWWGSAAATTTSSNRYDDDTNLEDIEGGRWAGLASALEAQEATLDKPLGEHWHLSDVPLPKVDPIGLMEKAAASLASHQAEEVQKQTLLSLGGLITFTLLDDEAVIDTVAPTWPRKRDDWSPSGVTTLSAPPSPVSPSPQVSATPPVAAWFQNTTIYDTPPSPPSLPASPSPSTYVEAPSQDTKISVLDSGSRPYADRIIWQPSSDHPDLSRRSTHIGELELTKLFKDDKDNYDSEDYEDNDSDERGRKAVKSKQDDEDEAPKRRKGKHSSDYDDENEEDGDSRKSRKKHKGGEYDNEQDRPTTTSKSGKKHGYEDDQDDSGSGTSSSRKHPADSDYDSEDGDDDLPRKRPSVASTSSVDPDPNANDCPALASFYRNMNGDSWTRDLGWLPSIRGRGSCCDWVGVSCDEYERVIGIRLTDVGLEGQMSDDLSTLDQLVRLYVPPPSALFLEGTRKADVK